MAREVVATYGALLVIAALVGQLVQADSAAVEPEPCRDNEACVAPAPEEETSLLAMRVHSVGKGSTGPQAPRKQGKYSHKPRVRREWRTLDDATRAKVAKALWTLKNVSTPEGRGIYGPRFFNYDDLVMQHICALFDPRCDQGHGGPSFITFHRAWLLTLELSMRSVDPSIEALPYWDFSLDEEGGKYYKTENWFFTDKYIGSFYGTGMNYIVSDGLFANWPVATFSTERFGKTSWMADKYQCIREEWFQPKQSFICDRCCTSTTWPFAKSSKNSGRCSCGRDDTFRTFLRNHNDCTPMVNRWPETPVFSFDGKVLGGELNFGGFSFGNLLGGSHNLHYHGSEFSACSNFNNTPSWMAWTNCVEGSFSVCGDPASPHNRPNRVSLLTTLIARAAGSARGATEAQWKLAALLQEMRPALVPCIGSSTTVAGYYDTLVKGASILPNQTGYSQWIQKARRYVHNMHITIHTALGLEYTDVSTSPNDVGAFPGHHANIDRSNMHWMEGAQSIADQNYLFPARQQVEGVGNPPYGVNGPYGSNSAYLCTSTVVSDTPLQTYHEYEKNAEIWIPGTMLDDVLNSGFGFFNLFECTEDAPTGESCKGKGSGYTHREILYWSHPSRTPYTYDTLADLYG